MARTRRDGNLTEATRLRVAALEDPDVALVALAFKLAAVLDDPEAFSAAAAKEYRHTLNALRGAELPSASSLDDLVDL